MKQLSPPLSAIAGILTGILSGCIAAPVVGIQVSPEPATCEPVEVDCTGITLPLDVAPIGDGDFARDSEREIEMVLTDSEALSDVSWRDTRFVVSASQNATLRLAHADLTHVVIVLGENVRLEIVGDSQLDDVMIASDPHEEGRAILIEDAWAAKLAVRAKGASEVRLSRVSAQDAVLDAPLLILDADSFLDSRIAAGDLLTAGGSFRNTELAAGTASIVSTRFERARLHRCQALQFVNATFETSEFAECEEPLLFRGGSINGSRVRGAAEFASMRIASSALAPGSENKVVMNDVRMSFSALCEAANVVATDSDIQCVSCDPEVAQPELSSSRVFAPECLSLQDAALEDLD
jgi:hypothetical protein